MNKVILLMVCAVLTTASAQAQRMYDGSERQLGRIDGERIYDASGRQIGHVDGLRRRQIILFFSSICDTAESMTPYAKGDKCRHLP